MHAGMKVLGFALAAAVCLGSSAAWAGELKIGSAPLEVDGKGKITKAGRDAAVSEIEASIPGEEAWTLHLWARIDNAATGPLYLEFYRDYKGKKLVANRFEYPDFDGAKYLSMDVEITRSDGFHIGDTVELAFVQNVGGRDVKRAKATIKLLANAQPVPDPEPEEEPQEEPEDDLDEAEAEEPEPDPTPAAAVEPPPAEPSKRGCTIGTPPPLWALLGLPVLWRRRD